MRCLHLASCPERLAGRVQKRLAAAPFGRVTAVGMTDHIPIMVIAVVVAVLVMLLAATPLSNFIGRNPTVVMLALGFLLMIGTALIAEGFGVKVPKGYIYAAMAFSALIEFLNIMARRARQKKT